MILDRAVMVALTVLTLSVNCYADEIIDDISLEEFIESENIDENKDQNEETEILDENKDSQENEILSDDPLPVEEEKKELIYNDSDGKYHEDYISNDQIYTLSANDLRAILEDVIIQVRTAEEESEEEEILIESADMENETMEFKSNNRSVSQSYNNTVIIYGSFNNTDCRLVIPRSSYDSLSVINGKLINIGNSAVTGRILYGDDNIDVNEYETYSYTLNPIAGSTSNVYNYGSFNYRRYYYLTSAVNGQRITYTDTYGDFTVSKIDVKYSSAHRLDYIALIGILFGGIALIWNRRRS